MLPCPHCQQRLTQVRSPRGLFWGCGACGGRAATLPVLRRHLDERLVRALWREARARGKPGRPCPMCARPMGAFVPTGGKHELDVCPSCHVVWFDPDEFERVAAAAPPQPESAPTPVRELPMEAREAIARRQLAVDRQRARAAAGAADTPDEWWKYGLALFGVPVETESHGLERLPLVTWTIGGLLVLTAVVTFGDLRYFVEEFGLLPVDPWRHGGLTFLTSFLLHGGIAHLLGNLYFLITFGDNVEDHIGHAWQLLLVACATVAGDALHMLVDRGGDLPLVGASGGISGLVAYYACAFPRARLGLFLWLYFYPHWISLSAIWFVGFWIVLQLIGAYMQIAGLSSISALAHLGGAAVGVVFYFLRGR